MSGIFIKTFLRNIRKNKGSFFVNLLGFTVGLSVSLLIFLYVMNELGYDKHHEKSERIYRLCIRASIGDTQFEQAFSSARVLREMRERYPEIEDAVKILSIDDVTTRIGDNVYNEDLFVMADSSLFSIFTIPVISGNPSTALIEPNSIALSESSAIKYFGSTDCIGELLEIDVPYIGNAPYSVKCVYKDMPDQSHFHFDHVVSSTTFPDILNNNGWSANNFVTYFLLNEGSSYKGLEDKFIQYVYDVMGGKEAYEARAAQGDYWEFYLQPIERIHLYSDVNGEWETNGNIKYIYIFSVIALFVLVIAIINFVNLSVARATLRSREVGIRKVAGSSRRHLMLNFMSESALITLLAFILSLLLVKLLIPFYNDWIDRSIDLNLFSGSGLFLWLIIGWFVLSILTGLYPALFLSSYKPLKVLKTGTVSESRGVGLRNVLVIIQFAASIFLIIGSIVITKEMKLLQDKNLGFIKSDILVVQTPPSFDGNQNIFRNELIRSPMIESVSFSSSLPGKGFNNIGFRAEGVDKGFTLNVFSADTRFDDLLGLEMAKGRFFSDEHLSDSNAVLLNETAVEVLGMTDPVGKYLSDNANNPTQYRIVGVIQDFHYESKHREMRPMGLFFQGGPWGSNTRYMSIKHQPGGESDVIESLEPVWDKYMPGIPMSHFYLAEEYDALYKNEKQTGEVFMLLSFLAILVACMGLFGLASFITQQKRPEVAMRKIMGASVQQLVIMLNSKYVRWLVLSFIIACPLAYYILIKWLDNFAYKIRISPLFFIIAGIATLLVAILTVTGITTRTANLNPAHVLRDE